MLWAIGSRTATGLRRCALVVRPRWQAGPSSARGLVDLPGRAQAAVGTEWDQLVDGERISKRLSRAGLCSRKEAERWILMGRVSIDGNTVHKPATRVDAKSVVSVDGKQVQDAQPMRLFIYHKMKKTMITNHDIQGRRTLFEMLDELGLPPGLKTVGRLDYMTSGLMLLTNDGTLARNLERSDLPRCYEAKVFGHIYRQRFNALQRDGWVRMLLDPPPGSKAPARRVLYSDVNVRVMDDDIFAAGGDQTRPSMRMAIRLHQGKNREVRHIMRHIGLGVASLVRTSYGPYTLKGLEPGDALEVRLRPEIVSMASKN